MQSLSSAIRSEVASLFGSMDEPKRTMCRVQYLHGKIKVRQSQGRDCDDLIDLHDRAMKHLDDIAEDRPPLVGIETK